MKTSLHAFAAQSPIPPERQKAIEFDILKAFDAFCRAHSLRYSLSDGTLLGAVRHRGFIPWDDDIDVYMLRPEYDRFVHLFSQSPTAPFAIVSGATDPDYPLNSIKIHDTRTVLFEGGKTYSFSGIYIDVFPLDAVPADPRHRERLIRRLLLFRAMKGEKVGHRQSHPNPVKNAVIAIRYALLKFVPMSVPRALHEWAVRRAARHADGRRVGNMASPGNLRNHFFPRSWFESSIQLPFEGSSFPATPHFDEYLTALYGDYMTPPPPEKRTFRHDSVCYFKKAPDRGDSPPGPLP